MQMARVETIEIPSGGSAALERGGQHAMVFDLDAKKMSETVQIDLQFSDGTALSTVASVKTMGGMER